MKKVLLLTVVLGVVTLVGCKDDEPEVDPLVGEWELDDASLVYEGYSYYGFENDNNWVGEGSYVIFFNEDFTYERILEDVPFTSGTDDLEEEGEWEKDEDELDLDSDDQEYDFLNYRFTIVELDDGTLVLEATTDPRSLFPDNKIEEWISDGVIDQQGFFTLTEDEIDSLATNFAEQAEGSVTIEFDKQ